MSILTFPLTFPFGGSSSSSSGGAVALEQLRLYATTATPVPIVDTTTVNTIYVGPFNGNTVTLLNSSNAYVNFALTEISLALSSLTSGKAYDVFIYSNAGTLTIELSTAWTDDFTRSDAVATVSGLVVKSSDHTRLHVGTIYTTSTTATSDTVGNRYIWNRFNQQLSAMNADADATTWNYSLATWRQARGSTANEFHYVTGDASTFVTAVVYSMHSGTSGNVQASVGVGINSTTVNSAQRNGSRTSSVTWVTATADYRGKPGLGRNKIVWLEISVATGTISWAGSTSVGAQIDGITGTLLN